MSKVEAAALVAAAAGYEFDLANQLQQLLPDLAQQVSLAGLCSCREEGSRIAAGNAVTLALQWCARSNTLIQLTAAQHQCTQK